MNPSVNPLPLLALCAQKGSLPFDEYMHLALYHPDWGYYQSRVNFSAAGDFITAPTTSSIFAHSLGRFLLRAPASDRNCLVELGPGNGQLAYDLLLFLQQEAAVPTVYYLVETSHYLRKLQQTRLQALPPELFKLVQWVQLDQLQNLTACVIANEFFDALPVVRFQIEADGVQELYVTHTDTGLVETAHAPRPELLVFYERLSKQVGRLPIGYRSEVCLCYQDIARVLAQVLHKGSLLIIDYGYAEKEYYQPMRRNGTLQAYYQHQVRADYLNVPGQMDLTAHVDFSRLVHSFMDLEFRFQFYTYQNLFLVEQGLLDEYAKLDHLAQQKVKRLLDSRLMGESFKVLGLGKNQALNYLPSHDLSRFL